ncbi:MAG TPA: sigma-70 family RNA polymerase sigma factor, partial [Polyangiaceae bacterium]
MTAPDQVKRALAGERAAIEALVRELSPIVRARVATMLWRRGHASRQELDDLTQEVLLQLFAGQSRVLASWQPDRGLGLPAFVGLVAKRIASSLLRSRRHGPSAYDVADPGTLDLLAPVEHLHPNPEGPVMARELVQLLFDHLHAELSPKALEMFYRLYVWQEEPEHISKETGSTLDAIYQWRSRLRKEVAELERSLLSRRMPVLGLVNHSNQG